MYLCIIHDKFQFADAEKAVQITYFLDRSIEICDVIEGRIAENWIESHNSEDLPWRAKVGVCVCVCVWACGRTFCPNWFQLKFPFLFPFAAHSLRIELCPRTWTVLCSPPTLVDNLDQSKDWHFYDAMKCWKKTNMLHIFDWRILRADTFHMRSTAKFVHWIVSNIHFHWDSVTAVYLFTSWPHNSTNMLYTHICVYIATSI